MGKKYVDVSGTSILGFYDDAVLQIPVPGTAIEITYSEWQNALAIGANTYDNGVFSKVNKILTPEEQNEVNERRRQRAYVKEAYSLFFHWQYTGLAADEVAWRDKVDEINALYPITPIP